MCGIAGFYKVTPHHHEIEQLTALLKHRGPDDQRTYEEGPLVVVHTRLAIIDLSAGGIQPYHYDGLTMVFNGAIYNYKDLREELKKLGYSFESSSDTEVLIKSFHCWREQCVDRLIGMFAFVVFDAHLDEIFLFRDRLGVKPLYYSFENGSLRFASELKAWTAFTSDLSIDAVALASYFRFGYVPGNLSIYKNVNKLEAGHFIRIDHSGLKKVRYWNYTGLPTAMGSENDLLDELEDLMVSSFKYRMESDVPVGVFLSGGIDSALLTAILQKHVGGINTFTIGFEERQFDESGRAADIASYLKTEHIGKKLRLEEARSLLEKFYSIYDEPFADTSGIPVACVTQLAKDHGMKVVLSADGGDELFGGYTHYKRTATLRRNFSNLPAALRTALAAGMRAAIPGSLKKSIIAFNFEHRASAFEELMNAKNDISFFESVLANQTHDEINALMSGAGVKATMPPFPTSGDFLNDMMAWDLRYYLPDDLLVKGDRATMYYGIEGREPFLDHRLVERAMTIPSKIKMKGGDPKYLLKKLLRRYLPDRLVTEKKAGFSIPIFQWFSADFDKLFSKHMSADGMKDIPFLSKDVVAHEYRKYISYKEKGKSYNIEKMWRLLSFMMWYEKWKK